MAALDEDARTDRRPRVPLGCAPDRQRKSPARAQHATRLRERLLDVRHEHVAALAEHAVDCVVFEIHALGIHDTKLDVLDTKLRGPALGDVDHVRREVGRDEQTFVSDDPGSLETEVARAGGEVEHGVATLRLELSDQPVVDGRGGLLEVRPPALPAGSHDLPDLQARLAVLLRLHPWMVGGFARRQRARAQKATPGSA